MAATTMTRTDFVLAAAQDVLEIETAVAITAHSKSDEDKLARYRTD